MLSISQQLNSAKQALSIARTNNAVALNAKINNTLSNVGYCVVCEADGQNGDPETGFIVDSYPFSFGHGLRSDKFGLRIPFASKITNLGVLFNIDGTLSSGQYIQFNLTHNDGIVAEGTVIQIRFKENDVIELYDSSGETLVFSMLSSMEIGSYNIEYKGIFDSNDAPILGYGLNEDIKFGIHQDDLVRISIFFQGTIQLATGSAEANLLTSISGATIVE